MKVFLHIGPDSDGARRFQANVVAQRDWFAQHGVLVPRQLGKRGNWRLHVASLLPDQVDPMRVARKVVSGPSHEIHTTDVRARLKKEVAQRDWKAVILTAPELATAVTTPTGFKRLFSLLPAPAHSVTVLTQVPPPRAGWVETLTAQFLKGRTTHFERDLDRLQNASSWWDDHKLVLGSWTWEKDGFATLELPPPWLDTGRFLDSWRRNFSTVIALPGDGDRQIVDAFDAVSEVLDLPPITARNAERDDPVPLPVPAILFELAKRNARDRKAGRTPDRSNIKRWLRSRRQTGQENATLPDLRVFESLELDWREQTGSESEALANDKSQSGGWISPTPRIVPARNTPKLPRLGPEAKKIFSKGMRDRFHEIVSGGFAPDNRLDPDQSRAPSTAFARRVATSHTRPQHLIVACMKDEGPYILEWIAHHRELGFDHFLIYTNDCSDGTADLLERLQSLGLVTHVDNSTWHGKSPQQAALNRAIETDLVRDAKWIAHIDVDEFINIRCGHGTLDDLFAALPDDTTNVAMTWRMFGNAGVARMQDVPVTRQFTRCAPSYCPKPHTMWGFKSLSRQNGIYAKISCHRPNKPDASRLGDLHWVNGSGETCAGDISMRGWRSTRKTAGYSLVQLNHYALRSLDSFLVKRQRGRALHVDRSIGGNYWARMDWNDHEERSIQRHAERTDASISELLRDAKTQAIHTACVDWHQSRAAELCADPRFVALVKETTKLRFNAPERVAYALSLDHDS